MASEKPSAWAVDIARKLTPVQCGFKGGSDLGWYGTMEAIATALDAAREQGRREREAEIVGWLRTDGPGSPADVYGSAVGGNEWTTAADAIKRGAGRKERP